jgi:tripartite-type tricarboxylate transporter receptor subunit TctC
VPFWTAIYAPRATPTPIIAALEAALRKAMRDPDVVRLLADVGTEPVGSTAAELDALTRQQFALYRGIVQTNKSLLGGP